MDRKALIRAAQAAVRKSFRGSVIDVASRSLEFPSVWASTGSLSLDRLFAGFNPGGVPMGPRYGRVIHLPGEWSMGKSLILDHLFRSVLVDLKGFAFRTETEGSADPHFADAIGLPTDLLEVDRPETFEQALDHFETWHEVIRREDDEVPVIWGFDSLDSTEAEKSASKGLSESGGWHYGGGRAEVLGAILRRMAVVCSKYPTTMVMLNQVRDNPQAMFGPKKRTPGGNPPHFYASLEVWLSPSPRPGGGIVRSDVPMPKLTEATVKRLGLYNLDDTAVIGRYVRAKVTKSKMSTTFGTTADFYLDFRRGVHRWEGLVERLVGEGLVRPNADMTEFEMGGTEFKTRKVLLNHLAQYPEVLALGGGNPPVGEQLGGEAPDTPEPEKLSQ